jgi:hypothetical protein
VIPTAAKIGHDQIGIAGHDLGITGHTLLGMGGHDGSEYAEFDRLPSTNRALVHDLATGRYIDERAPVLIVGPCGTGKSIWRRRSGTAPCVRGTTSSSPPARSCSPA